MATGQIDLVLRHVRRLAGQVHGLTDGQLVERFGRQKEEAAFEELVHRFGSMVLGACRRVLGDHHDAEDAFQATFLVLARKAPSLAQPEMVGSWLFGVAYYTARNLRASRSRRQAAEKQVLEMPRAQPTHPQTPSDLQELLDEELSRLPEKYRAPVVLCELHGTSRREAARQLGCNEGTLSSRLARARQLLRQRLGRRGLLLSAAGLAAALAERSAPAAVPASLTIHTVQAAMTLAAGHAAAGAVSAPVAALTEGVLKAMFLQKLKSLLVLGVVIALLGAGVGVFTCQALASKPPVEAPTVKNGTITSIKNGTANSTKNAEADKGEKKEQGPSVQGVLESVDAGKNQIKVAVRVEGTKQVEEKTFDLTKDAKVFLYDTVAKGQEPPEAKVTDLPQGTNVHLRLSEDKKAVVAIHARGPGLQGKVKSVDAGKNSIHVTFKDGKGLAERTIELVKDARIMLSNGLSKSEQGQEGKLTDLTEGTSVSLQLTVDQKRALLAQVRGASIQGEVKGVDVGNNTITVTLKEDGQVVEKTYTVHKEARVEGGKLTDLTAGTPVALQMSVFDKKEVVAVRSLEKKKDKE